MDFLLRRPIAVVMAFLAAVLIGVATYRTLPVSLLPDIEIPQISIQIAAPDKSAREIENTIVSNIRQQLLQVSGLDEITSTARDGIGVINMRFKFGTNTDYSYIEVNEKIDAAMNYLPAGTRRPKAIKASASDIPVLYLNVSLSDIDSGDKTKFLEMCDAVENIIRRRIEQLPEVAMADVTGIPQQCIKITPDYDKMRFLNISPSNISNILTSNNIEAGSIRVKDGVYEYTVRVSTLLRNIDDVQNVYVTINGHHLQLRDFCDIRMETQQEQGFSLANGQRVVTLAIIKQADEGMEQMRGRIGELMAQFSAQFPNLKFEVCRNQTELLDYTISNLKQNLILGFILIIIVSILFMGGIRQSIVIGISMIAAVVITFVVFYFAGRSLNIVSLSGMILVVGMMIDNALIVSENIAQWQQRGFTLRVSCAGATREMISPLLSSTLTTVAVFVPLVFVQGMAGAMFGDQAFAITAGLGVSYVVGIVLLPVLYKILMARPTIRNRATTSHKMDYISGFYNKGFDFAMRHKTIILIIALATLPLCWVLFGMVIKSKMPQISYSELTATIEWNAEISLDENRRRSEQLLAATRDFCSTQTSYVGAQDYIVESGNTLSMTEADFYWKTFSTDSVAILRGKITDFMAENYPSASIKFAPPMTIFEKLFDTSEPDIEARLAYSGGEMDADQIREIVAEVRAVDTAALSSSPAFKNVKMLIINREALQLYNVSISELRSRLMNTIAGTRITELHSYSAYMPVYLADSGESVDDFVKTGSIEITDPNTNQKVFVPVRQLVKIANGEELKNIVAGKTGEYIPVCFYGVTDGEILSKNIETLVSKRKNWDVEFGGSFFSNKLMMTQLVVILIISLALMYFILCAQFESFLQPLIVLLEIPIDIAAALFVLWITGISLNLMSGIGIIVSCGIIINDSILKIDTINELRKQGLTIKDAVHTAGLRRLRAIIMTSLTTIGAMLPILFTSDMGSELQQPLAVVMIASMTIGTLVSLFVIPVAYTKIAGS